MGEIFFDIFLGIIIPFLLVATGIFFGFYLKWFHIFHPVRTMRRALKESGGSAFSGLFLALAGTLGVGNVVGVASAIALGGYGAIFWMWVSALFAMILKYAEIVLAMTHRDKKKDGTYVGGAMFYIKDCFMKIGYKNTGMFLSIFFALLMCIVAISMGGLIQVGAVSEALHREFGIPELAVSVSLALIVLVIICSGKTGLVSVTDRIVPIMTGGYLILSVAALIAKIDVLDDAFVLIVKDAFTPMAAAGGFFGFLNTRALRLGTMRGLISNEAGCGTSPIAHALSRCNRSGAQGVFGIFEVFVDTIVLCTVTALVIIVSDVPLTGSEFMMITIDAYSGILGGFAGKFMALAVLFFGFATVVCWSHYGVVCIEYISKKRWTKRIFVAIYLIFAALGGIASSEIVWLTADMAVGIMTLINLIVLVFMRKEIREESDFLMRRY